ncbi:hypothetical protein KDW_26720 [Dictyobacter vulcani]|uniref:Uncharacterized protein n=1 Tax=Dictyobacter vulcani TaxID=2607529 RepID=A0A5J4KQ11_9CHLR|nr:hypothetical protein [Dictyobacter vulcani]GER88510.1 hypothetical protein KDW_26720 [Dictyobacter vulcani]
MTTTGELRSIIEELELVDVGDAVTYLDEDDQNVGDVPDMTALNLASCLQYIAGSSELDYQLC